MGSRERCCGMGPCAAYPDPVMPHKPRGAMTDGPARPPRFPFVAAILCAACLGAVAWTWMRYSYAWGMTPAQLAGGWYVPDRLPGIPGNTEDRAFVGVYVRLSGFLNPDSRSPYSPDTWVWASRAGGHGVSANNGHDLRPGPGGQVTVYGRVSVYAVRWSEGYRAQYVVDNHSSRFTGASIAGLVVGAMGVFVFTVALRHWLGDRRRFREEARA